ncbi:hypothetical protein ACIA8O_24925 [Kitasatospora sp. NPDC051853]|uniref:hypothetical protein n=1 Tax=Kitasatospora sp. NPDC051853 TaxID=3364058 RepID=UPI0037BE1592
MGEPEDREDDGPGDGRVLENVVAHVGLVLAGAAAWAAFRCDLPILGRCLAGGYGATFLLLLTDRLLRRWGVWRALSFAYRWTFWWPTMLVVAFLGYS